MPKVKKPYDQNKKYLEILEIIHKTSSLKEVYNKVKKSQPQIYRSVASLHKDGLICGENTKLNRNDKVLITTKGRLILYLAYQHRMYNFVIKGLEKTKDITEKIYKKRVAEIMCVLKDLEE